MWCFLNLGADCERAPGRAREARTRGVRWLAHGSARPYGVEAEAAPWAAALCDGRLQLVREQLRRAREDEKLAPAAC